MATSTDTLFSATEFSDGWQRAIDTLKENELREDYISWLELRDETQKSMTTTAHRGYRAAIIEAIDLAWLIDPNDDDKTLTRLEQIGPPGFDKPVVHYGPHVGDDDFNDRKRWLVSGYCEGIAAIRAGHQSASEDAFLAWMRCRTTRRNGTSQRAMDRARGRCDGCRDAKEVEEVLDDEQAARAAMDAMIETAQRENDIPFVQRFLPEPPKPLPRSLAKFASEACEDLGFITEVMALNLSSAPKPQPIFALGGALALTAAIVGRRVRDEYDTRPNLQIIAVGETSSGKDYSRWLNDEILAQSDNAVIITPQEVTSDTAIYRTLEQYPSRLAQFDEFGRFLQTATAGQNHHLYAVVSALMKLYSSADRSQFIPKTYANKRDCPDIVIAYPHIVLHATSTPEAVYSGLGASAEDDGFLGRCLIFESPEQPRKVMRPRKEIPDSVLEFGRSWASRQDIVGDLLGPPAVTVPTSDDANKIFEAFEERCHDKLVGKSKGSKLWGRGEQKARQVALVVACSKNPEAPQIDKETARWACHLVGLIAEHMQGLSLRWLASNKLEAEVQRLLRVIEDAEPRGLSKAEITRKSQWLSRRDRDQHLHTLTDAGLIYLDDDGRVHAVVSH